MSMRTLRWKPKRLAAVVIPSGLLILILIKILSIPTRYDSRGLASDEYSHKVETISPIETANPFGHKLAVIVPFRDRFEELMEFVPHLHSFLNNASVDHHIYIINQADKLRFNRAALINVGYKMSAIECDYLAMHDVDLLPMNPLLNYGYPEGHVFHVAAPNLHPLYHYKTFVGGILLLTHQDFDRLNGLSNRYWGWGREDDEFYVRMKEARITIERPDVEKITTGYNTFRHIHDRQRRPRDNRRYGEQKKSGSHRDRKTGLRDVNFIITEIYPITIHKAPATVYNVELGCDRADTPWCENPIA